MVSFSATPFCITQTQLNIGHDQMAAAGALWWCHEKWCKKGWGGGNNQTPHSQCWPSPEAADKCFYGEHSWSTCSSCLNNQNGGTRLLLQKGLGFPMSPFDPNLPRKAQQEATLRQVQMTHLILPILKQTK